MRKPEFISNLNSIYFIVAATNIKYLIIENKATDSLVYLLQNSFGFINTFLHFYFTNVEIPTLNTNMSIIKRKTARKSTY